MPASAFPPLSAMVAIPALVFLEENSHQDTGRASRQSRAILVCAEIKVAGN